MSESTNQSIIQLACDTLWTADDVAQYLCCSTKHVLRLAILGQIPAHNIATQGKRQATWRFEPDEVREWVAQMR